jgi:hypothetical protein
LGSATLALVLTVVAYAVRPVAEWRTVLELLLLAGTLLVVGPPKRMELALLMDETP